MSEENRKKEETMEEPTREMEKETGAETDLPETEPAAEQEEAKKAAEAKEAEAAEETAEDGKERKFFKKKKDKKDEKIEELTDRLTRQMAEFDNFRKRTEKEKANMYAIGAKDIIEKILPVVDSFERGLATVENPEEDPFADGMNKVYKQFTTALDELGVTVIEAVGKEFDPNLHNAVMHVEDEEAGENIVGGGSTSRSSHAFREKDMKNLENAGIHPKEINWFFGSRISVDIHKKSHDFFSMSVHNILLYNRGVFIIRVKKKL